MTNNGNHLVARIHSNHCVKQKRPFILYVCCMIVFIFSLFCGPTQARDWQLMLIKNADMQAFTEQQQAQFEAGVKDAIAQGLNDLISAEFVYTKCTGRWCQEASMETLLAKIKATAPQTQLVMLYELVKHTNKHTNKHIIAQVQLIDPLSYQVRFNHSMELTKNLADRSFFNMGRIFGESIDSKLSQTRPVSSYIVQLDAFEAKEVTGFSTFLLANAFNQDLQLIKSAQIYLLGQYFPITNSQYRLQSALNASQLQQLIARFFEQKNIGINVKFDLTTQQMHILRQGNPYAPSVITWLLIFVCILLVAIIFVRRQYLQYYLVEYAKQHNADAWLATYHKSKFPLYRLQGKWRSRASYWERLQKESNEFFEQAKVYFDAGDMNTAKLFISKALHSNVANAKATKLVKEIAAIESNTKSLSDTEQWIRNKIAKAMNNYRQQQVFKALRQLYQAYEKAKQAKSLKKQSKAINKLIKNIGAEFSNECQSAVINCSSDPTSILLCQNETIHLGRLPSKTDIPYISPQDAVFFINHKQVSRIGQHCRISRQGKTYSLTDMGSKNGSFINAEACIAQQAVTLKNGDRVQLGSHSNVSALTLQATLSQFETLLTLEYIPPSTNLVDRNALNRVWPDNALAVRTKLTCMQDVCVLTYNIEKKTMRLQEILITESDKFSGLSKSALLNAVSEKDNEVLVCAIRLGKQASIAPLNHENDVFVDNEPLIGQVPLIFPCNIECSDVHFQLTEYDSTTLRYAQKHLTQIRDEVEGA